MAETTLRTIDEAAIVMATSVKSVRLLIDSGKLVAINVGSGELRPRWRIRQEDLDAFLESRRSKPVAKPAPRRRKVNHDVVKFF